MHIYDYSFLKDAVPGNIVSLTEIIADRRSREGFRKREYGERFERLSQEAMVAS